MKTYHGERTERGCEVTVDGEPLRRRSDLSGCATSAFEWGFVGTGQLSVAMLSDFLGDDPKAKALCKAFDNEVVANLPNHSWTLTGQDLTEALNDIDAKGDGRSDEPTVARASVASSLGAPVTSDRDGDGQTFVMLPDGRLLRDLSGSDLTAVAQQSRRNAAIQVRRAKMRCG